MERYEIELLERHIVNDKVLETLYKEHCNFERELEKFNNKPYLTPTEEMEKKTIQKKKLRGRDMIEEILRRYKKADAGA
jgi:hypothetical protein